MDKIEHLAELSVRRACGFAAIGVVTAMFGMVHDPILCLRGGAWMVTIIGLVLAWFAYRAPRRDPRTTEVWLMLDSGRDLPPNYPRAIISQILQDTYVRYARRCGAIALALWAASLLASFWF